MFLSLSFLPNLVEKFNLKISKMYRMLKTHREIWGTYKITESEWIYNNVSVHVKEASYIKTKLAEGLFISE